LLVLPARTDIVVTQGRNNVYSSDSKHLTCWCKHMQKDRVNLERYEEWVKVSLCFAIIHPNLMHYIQMLGIVDAELNAVRYDDLYGPDGVPFEDDNGFLLLEHCQIKATMWALAVYEFIRVLDQRVSHDIDLITNHVTKELITDTKRKVARLRMPLAKLEASSKHRKTDYDFAFQGMTEEGIAWQVSDDIVISQKEISDAFLRVLQSFRVDRIRQNIDREITNHDEPKFNES
jgi:hypothetical protein